MLPLLLWKWSQGYQLVYTRRRKQQGRGLLKEQASRLFYAAINRLSEIRFEDGESALLDLEGGVFRVSSLGTVPSRARSPAEARTIVVRHPGALRF